MEMKTALSHSKSQRGKAHGISVPSWFPLPLFPLSALVPLWLSLILSCAPGTQSLKTSMPKLKIDPKTIKEIPGYLDLAKLKVIYEDGEFIKWIDEKGRTNISYEPGKYQPKPVKQDEYKFCQVDGDSNAVYKFPDTTSEIVDTVNNVSLVKIVEEQKYFTKIITPKNIEGWIYRAGMSDYALKKYDDYGRKSERKNGQLVILEKSGNIVVSKPLEIIEKKTVVGPSAIKNTYGEQVYNELINLSKEIGVDVSTVRSVKYYHGTGSVIGPGYMYVDTYQFDTADGKRLIDLNHNTISGFGDVKIQVDGIGVNVGGEYKQAYFVKKGDYFNTFFTWSKPVDYSDPYAGDKEYACLYKNDKLIFQQQIGGPGMTGHAFIETNHLLIRIYEDYVANGKEMSRRYYLDPLTRRVVYSVEYSRREMGMELEIEKGIIIQYEYDKATKKESVYHVFDLNTGKKIQK